MNTADDSAVLPQSWDLPARIAETHISVLVFIGDRAYKLKKPVAFGFIDFTTREARRRACEAEVEVNRRFSPDIYLGVADVLGADGTPCDHLVVMRRMPADRRLAELVRRGEDVNMPLWDLARILARSHAAAPTTPAMAEVAGVGALRRRWDDNFAAVAPFGGTILDEAANERVEVLVQRYLAGRGDLFTARIAEGKVRDGHGDLQAEDIFCLPDGPRILDAIEFDERLRWGDVLADVAFLAMDLERIGRPELGARFLAAYRELSGETWPESLADHYIAYRAHIRTKVACLRFAQGHHPSGQQARHLLGIALTHLERATVRLVLVGGLPGTGKSTLSAELAAAGVGVVLRSDEIRKELAGLGHDASGGAAFGDGIYAPEHTEATYRELLRRAGRLLALGQSVILDASWTSEQWRKQAEQLSHAASADLVQLDCTCPPAVAHARLERRRGDVSDATPAVAVALAARRDPWPSALSIDTDVPLSHSLAGALDHIGIAPSR